MQLWFWGFILGLCKSAGKHSSILKNTNKFTIFVQERISAFVIYWKVYVIIQYFKTKQYSASVNGIHKINLTSFLSVLFPFPHVL